MAPGRRSLCPEHRSQEQLWLTYLAVRAASLRGKNGISFILVSSEAHRPHLTRAARNRDTHRALSSPVPLLHQGCCTFSVSHT